MGSDLLKQDCLLRTCYTFPTEVLACEEATQPGMLLLASDLLAVYISVTLQLGLHAPTLIGQKKLKSRTTVGSELVLHLARQCMEAVERTRSPLSST